MTRPNLNLFVQATVLAALLALPAALPVAASARTASAPSTRTDTSLVNEADYLTLYPGVYAPNEGALVQAYLAANAALEKRGPVDVARLIAGTLPPGTPGIGPKIKVGRPWVRYYAQKFDPTSRLRNDRDYAVGLGFDDIVAYPNFGTNDDYFMTPYPAAARDKLMVSQLNHSTTNLKPIYPGDTLFLVTDKRTVDDITPPTGSKFRSVAITSNGSVYNQRGEKVNEVTFRVVENIMIRKDGHHLANPAFKDFWIGPDWERRPPHYYTDKDWQFIERIWSQEQARGATPLYWQDVNVGDTPQWTIDGPVLASTLPVKPWGLGKFGSRTLKREILDPATRATLVRGKVDGIYRPADRAVLVPPPPADADGVEAADAQAGFDTTQIHQDGAGRSVLVNYMGRDFAIRHITNWMGDRGWIRTMRWGIMGPAAMAAVGRTIPGHPDAIDFLKGVPAVQGREPTTHPMTGDIYLIKSQVTRKYVENGAFLVDLAWWSETISGQIDEAGLATIELPSNTAADPAVVAHTLARH